MTRTWVGKSGVTIDINVAGNRYLDRICYGLFEKIGCDPHTKEDCLLIARVIRNRLHLNQYWQPYWGRDYEIEFLEEEMVVWLQEVQAFFEQADGIVEE